MKTSGALRNDGILLSSAHMRTDAGPMADLQRMACEMIRPPILDVSVYGGFVYANTAHIGASVMAWSEDGPEAAKRVVDRLWQTLRQRASEFDLPLLAPSEAIATAMKTPGLVAVTDAALVQRARAAGIGAVLPVQLGGQRSSDHGPPVLLHAQVVLLTDGRFINTGPMERGSVVHCGQSVVLRADRLRVIVTEHVAPCNDPAFFALHGVDLSPTRLLCVKAKKHFRAAFASLCAAIVDAHAPGPASLDLALPPLRRRVN